MQVQGKTLQAEMTSLMRPVIFQISGETVHLLHVFLYALDARAQEIQ